MKRKETRKQEHKKNTINFALLVEVDWYWHRRIDIGKKGD
jgi:hypothetical protein